MGYAFISYSSQNQISADAMRNLLKKHNVDTWMAPYDIPAGSEYAEVIHDAIIKSSCLVLMLTDMSQNSKWVKKEVNNAIDAGKTIIPVKLGEVELNSSMKFYLGDQQITPVYTIDEKSNEILKILKSIIGLATADSDETKNTSDCNTSTELKKVSQNTLTEEERNEAIKKIDALRKRAHNIRLELLGASKMLDELEAKEIIADDNGTIEIPVGTEIIGERAFNCRKDIRKVVLPEGLVKIEDSAFNACHNLKEVNIPTSVRCIGGGAFARCFKLKKLIFPDGIEELSMGVCQHCSSLEEIRIPESVKLISRIAFWYCYHLKEVYIPNPVCEIEDEAFDGCANIKILTPHGSLVEQYAKTLNLDKKHR